MKKLLPVDLFIGSLIGIAMFPWFGWWAIAFAIVTALLWAAGGQWGHSIRFIGIPIVLGAPILWNSPFPHLWPILPCIPIGIFCCLGYGLPSLFDKGAPLGIWWYELIEKFEQSPVDLRLRYNLATIGARGTIVVGIWLSMTPWLLLLIYNK